MLVSKSARICLGATAMRVLITSSRRPWGNCDAIIPSSTASCFCSLVASCVISWSIALNIASASRDVSSGEWVRAICFAFTFEKSTPLKNRFPLDGAFNVRHCSARTRAASAPKYLSHRYVCIIAVVSGD
ncbi:hypothetical protein D3C73_648880 [compost metagenome]